jgi:hypothetical protein
MLRKIAVAGLCLATAHSAAVDQLQKRDGAGGHHAHGADAGGYGAPPATYEEPAAEYGAPATTYEQPADSYGVSYGGYEEETLPDLTPIIVGILVLTGLSLLFPTFVSLTSVRRKRHAEDDVNPMTDVVERVNDIYSAVIKSEECLERIACEIGGLASDVGLTQSPAIKLAGGFVPSKYKNYYKQFSSGKDCQKIKCGTFA